MTKKLWILASAGLLVSAGTAVADEAVVYQPSDYAWTDARKLTRIGVGMSVGAGFAGFTDGFTNDALRNAGTWNVRVAFGTHIPLGLELGYAGMSASFSQANGFERDFDGMTLEALARWNVLPHMAFTPYVLVGVGWQHYNATPTDANDLLDRDIDAAAMPLAVGFAYRMDNGIAFDVRGTYRIVDDPEVVTDANFEIDSWETTVSVGYDI